MSPLFKIVVTLIRAGRTEGLEEKCQIFLLAERITLDEYNQIMNMLHPKGQT